MTKELQYRYLAAQTALDTHRAQVDALQIAGQVIEKEFMEVRRLIGLLPPGVYPISTTEAIVRVAGQREFFRMPIVRGGK